MRKVDVTSWERWDFVKFYSQQWRLPVLPVRANKHPDVKEWNPYKVVPPTLDELEQWFVKRHPWGLTLILQNKLFAIDFDNPAGYDLLKSHIPPGAAIAKTPHGYHIVMHSSTVVPETIKGTNRHWLYCVEQIDPRLVETLKDGTKQAKIDFLGNNSLLHSPDSPGYSWLQLYNEPIAVPLEGWLQETFGYLVPKRRLTDYVKVGHTTKARWVNMFCPWCEFDGLRHDSPSCSVDLAGGGYKCHGSCGRQGKLTEFVEQAQQVGYPLSDEIMRAYRQLTTLPTKPTADRQSAPILEVPLMQYKPSKHAESLIEGLAETRDRIAIAASPGEGKTTKIQCLALQAALGLPVWSRFAVPRALKVALIEEELTGERPQQIVAHIAENIGIQPPPENLKLYRAQKWVGEQLVETAFEITNDEDMGQLTQALMRYNPDLIILDGWYKFVVNQENEDMIVNKALAWMDTVTSATNACLIVVCHTRKYIQGNIGAGRFDSISGKGLNRWARTKLILRRMTESWKLYSKIEGSCSNPEWGDLLYLLYWNPETWVTKVVSKEDAPADLWRIVFPDTSRAESRDLMLRARAVGLTDKDIAAVAAVTDRAVRYWRSGSRAMTGDKVHLLLTKVRQLEK